MEELTKEVGWIWATLSLVIAGIAQGKNRSGFWWWVLSLFLGPFALLILLLVSKLPDEQETVEE